jgi:hypothetical protein
VAYPYESSVDVVAADASPVKEGVRAVGAQMDLNLRHNEMRPHRAFRDLQPECPAGHAIVFPTSRLWKCGQRSRVADRPREEQKQKKRTDYVLSKSDNLIRYRQRLSGFSRIGASASAGRGKLKTVQNSHR